jgi:hypothetical protein
MPKTTIDQLTEVQTAITAVCAGQSVTFDGKQVTYADLDALDRREENLLARYRVEQGTGGMTINIGIPRR